MTRFVWLIVVGAAWVIHHAQLLIRHVVHTAEICEPIQLDTRVAAHELGDLPPVLGGRVNARVAVVGQCFSDLPDELVGQDLSDLSRGHAPKPTGTGNAFARVRFAAGNG